MTARELCNVISVTVDDSRCRAAMLAALRDLEGDGYRPSFPRVIEHVDHGYVVAPSTVRVVDDCPDTERSPSWGAR